MFLRREMTINIKVSVTMYAARCSLKKESNKSSQFIPRKEKKKSKYIWSAPQRNGAKPPPPPRPPPRLVTYTTPSPNHATTTTTTPTETRTRGR
uniref:Uncharacterized protein n=1 Tax=Oryza brachyantha TaxID=4533 RepID=J3MMB1_ORYBR